MAKPPKPKSDNKSKDEKVKPTKDLSPKRQTEADHLAGKHPAQTAEDVMQTRSRNPECGFCQRRVKRFTNRDQATKRFLAGAKK